MRITTGTATLLMVLAGAETAAADPESIDLPEPRLDSDYSVEQALLSRRSVRSFSSAPLRVAELGQLLWAAQGITSKKGYRTAPSAGALYPLELHVAVGEVDGLAPGIYRYRPKDHRLQLRLEGDKREALARAAVHQTWMKQSPAMLVFAAVPSRTTRKYGSRGERYVQIEVGHAAQNVFLQAQSLGLAAAVVGAFDEDDVDRLLDLPAGQRTLYLMPVGHP